MKCPKCIRDNMTDKEVQMHLKVFHKEKVQHQPQVAGVCPECKGTLMMTEGCCLCHSCGYSKCGG
jgi:ribonucleoside-diphosphate reductase alpha chain